MFLRVVSIVIAALLAACSACSATQTSRPADTRRIFEFEIRDGALDLALRRGLREPSVKRMEKVDSVWHIEVVGVCRGHYRFVIDEQGNVLAIKEIALPR